MKEATQQLLDKATRAIHVAETLLQAGDVEFATGRAYYAMFYVAEASLNERGLHFCRHGRVHAAFSVEFMLSSGLDSVENRCGPVWEALGKPYLQRCRYRCARADRSVVCSIAHPLPQAPTVPQCRLR